MTKKKKRMPEDIKLRQRRNGQAALTLTSGETVSEIRSRRGSTLSHIVKTGRKNIGKALGQRGKMVLNRAKKARAKKK